MSTAWIKKSLIHTGALRFASRFAPGGVAIVMYHSVMEDPATVETTLGRIVHSTKVFRAQMELVSRYFHAVSLDDVLLFLKGEKALPPRPVVITFDDGYADNYPAANGILRPLGIPGVFYVTVGCIDQQRLPWPSILRHAFLTTKKDRWREADGRDWFLSSAEQRTLAFDRASEHCSRLSGIAQEEFIDSVERQLGTEPIQPLPRLMMTWDEVRGLARGGHTVGSHTLTHPNLAHIAESEMRSELAEANRKLEQEISLPVIHLSYPCPALQPHWTERTVRACQEIGYQTAVTTNDGLVRRPDDPFTLRRIRPTKTVEGFRWNLERTFLRRML
jgi:peptidoglycan/xylan/chitin deacetylase (PgdA/CDA1 family)